MDEREPPMTAVAVRPFGLLHALFWASLALFSMLALATLAMAMRPEAGGDLVTLGGLSAVAFLGTSALLLGKHPAGSHLGHALGLRGGVPGITPLAFVLGAALQIPAEALSRVSERFLPLSEEETSSRIEMLRAHSDVHAVALVFVAALLVPLAEEVFFRGALYGALRRSRHTALVAALATSVAFTLCHVDPTILLPIGFVAIVFGMLRAATGSLIPSIAAHVGFNGLTMLASVTGARPPNGEPLSPDVELVGYVVSGLGILVAALVAWRSPAAARDRALDAVTLPEEAAA